MHLYHYSDKPLTLEARNYHECDDRVWGNDHYFKPRGLWFSVDDDEPDAHGWKQWCESEDFRIESLRHRTEIELASDSNVLHLDSIAALDQFTHKYIHDTRYRLESIDWPRVQREYQAIIIAPYQWQRRLDLMWYYSWDCASGCVWDLSIVKILEGVVR